MSLAFKNLMFFLFFWCRRVYIRVFEQFVTHCDLGEIMDFDLAKLT